MRVGRYRRGCARCDLRGLCFIGGFLVNVSDIRPVPLSTDCAMRLAWNATPWLARGDAENQEAFLNDWSRRQLGPELAWEVAALYGRYFDIPYQRSDQRKGDNAAHSMLHKLANTIKPLLLAGQPPSAAVRKSLGDAQQFAAANLAYVEQLLATATALEPRACRPGGAISSRPIC